MEPWVHAGIRAVFFDAVGTLIFPDPSAPVVYAAAARRQGLHVPNDQILERFLAAYRTQEAADRAAGWVTSEARERERWSHIVCHTLRGVPDPDACFAELFGHFAEPVAWRVNREAPAVFAHLRERGIILGIGSNYDSRLLRVVEGHTELGALRDRVVISAAVGFRKPSLEYFRELTRSAGCEPGEVLFVGDDVENDYEGATAARLSAVLYDNRGRHAAVARRIVGLGELIAAPV
jgi:putative hydrolase of the HAD superfamily